MKKEEAIIVTKEEFTAMNILFDILREYLTEEVIADIYFKYCIEIDNKKLQKK